MTDAKPTDGQTTPETPAEDWGEFGEFKVEAVRKPTPGIQVGIIPPPLVKMLEEFAPKALKDPDFELTLTAKDAAMAKRLALYARAWGAQQTPKLYIHKVPNRRDMKDNVARLAVELDEDVPAENRPGRKSK